MRRVVTVILGLVLANTAFADKFLGVEGATAAPPKASPMKRRATPPQPSSSNGTPDILVSGGVGAGVGYFSGHVTVGYSFNRWVGIDTTVNYLRYERNSSKGEQYGPESALIFRAPNPTFVTPFVGAGPGYQQWKREADGEEFDKDDGFMANAFGGLSVRMARHFGLELVRKQTRWLTTPPRSFADPEVREKKVALTNTVGFNVMF